MGQAGGGDTDERITWPAWIWVATYLGQTLADGPLRALGSHGRVSSRMAQPWGSTTPEAAASSLPSR